MMKRSGRENLWIVIPAYNEEKNIETVIRQWHAIVDKTGEDSRLLLVDDGSKDHTLNIARHLQKTCPRLVAVTKENGGHGAAVLFGYHYAVSHGADYIFQTDSDGQTLPEEFWPLWAEPGAGRAAAWIQKAPSGRMGRILVTKTLKLIVAMMFGVCMEDINTPFRLMRGGGTGKNPEAGAEALSSVQVIISVLYKKSGRTVRYYPITFRPRQAGKNSVNFIKICRMGKNALAEFWYLRKKYRKV